MKTKTEHVHARIAPEQHAALERISVEEDLSIVTLIREAVELRTGVKNPLKKTRRGAGFYEGNSGNPYMRRTATET